MMLQQSSGSLKQRGRGASPYSNQPAAKLRLNVVRREGLGDHVTRTNYRGRQQRGKRVQAHGRQSVVKVRTFGELGTLVVADALAGLTWGGRFPVRRRTIAARLARFGLGVAGLAALRPNAWNCAAPARR